MSAYIENNHHNNISQYLPTCEAPNGFSLKQIAARIKFWVRRSQQRKQLARLDARMLADIGITQDQADIEVSKPFWK